MERKELEFLQMCPSPARDFVVRLYSKILCVNISRCLVIPAFPQHVSRSSLQREHHKSDGRNAPCTAAGAHTHSKGDVVGLVLVLSR